MSWEPVLHDTEVQETRIPPYLAVCMVNGLPGIALNETTVLTCAHGFDGREHKADVHPGFTAYGPGKTDPIGVFYSDKVLIHPSYRGSNGGNWWPHDLAIVTLRNPMPDLGFPKLGWDHSLPATLEVIGYPASEYEDAQVMTRKTDRVASKNGFIEIYARTEGGYSGAPLVEFHVQTGGDPYFYVHGINSGGASGKDYSLAASLHNGSNREWLTRVMAENPARQYVPNSDLTAGMKFLDKREWDRADDGAGPWGNPRFLQGNGLSIKAPDDQTWGTWSLKHPKDLTGIKALFLDLETSDDDGPGNVAYRLRLNQEGKYATLGDTIPAGRRGVRLDIPYGFTLATIGFDIMAFFPGAANGEVRLRGVTAVR